MRTEGTAVPAPVAPALVHWARYDARFDEPGAVKLWSGVDAFTCSCTEERAGRR
jgi:hypothetical protein